MLLNQSPAREEKASGGGSHADGHRNYA